MKLFSLTSILRFYRSLSLPTLALFFYFPAFFSKSVMPRRVFVRFFHRLVDIELNLCCVGRRNFRARREICLKKEMKKNFQIVWEFTFTLANMKWESKKLLEGRPVHSAQRLMRGGEASNVMKGKHSSCDFSVNLRALGDGWKKKISPTSNATLSEFPWR